MGEKITLTSCTVYTLDTNAIIYYIRDDSEAVPNPFCGVCLSTSYLHAVGDGADDHASPGLHRKSRTSLDWGRKSRTSPDYKKDSRNPGGKSGDGGRQRQRGQSTGYHC